MTTDDFYIVGYACGILDAAVQRSGDETPRLKTWSERPLSCLIETTNRTREVGALDQKTDWRISEIISETSSPQPGDSERWAAPTETEQFEFQRGYYTAIKDERESPAENEPVPLATRRKKAGLTQAELANALGVDRTQISHWERGITIPMKYKEKIEQVLGGK